MRLWISIDAVALALSAAALLGPAWRLVEAVRLRNALLADPSTPADFAWLPPDFPPGFRTERRAATALFARVVTALEVARLPGDWEKALALAGHLAENAADRGPIRAGLEVTYRGIREGRGYCADFARVFLALAHAAGLHARQWSFSFDGFGGHGHVIVEVFDRARGKWLFLDVYNNFHALDAASGEPLSALELRECALGVRPAAQFRPNGLGRPGWRHEHKARDYYARGACEWYLWYGNDVFSYDAHPAVALANRLSGSLGEIVATAIGVHPRIRIFVTSENEQAVRAVVRLARRTRVLTFAVVVLAVALVAGTCTKGGAP